MSPQILTPSEGTSIEHLARCVVRVVRSKNGLDAGTGSGTIFSPLGLVLTNNHVVQDLNFGAALDDLSVELFDDVRKSASLRLKAEIVIRNEAHDLAILRILDPTMLQHCDLLSLERNIRTRIGTSVDILGFPAVGGPTLTLTKGVVSGLDEEGNYKTDAEINFGNSGGAAFNKDGQFIGVPSFVATDAGGKVGYIISLRRILEWLNSILKSGLPIQTSDLDSSFDFKNLTYDRMNLGREPNYPRIIAKFAAIEMLLRDGPSDKIVTLAQAILSKRPNSPLAHNYLGVYFMGDGNYVDAIKHFKTALLYDPTRIPALGNLATTLAILGRYSEALPIFEQVPELTEDPTLVGPSYENIAKIYRLIGRPEVARLYESKAAECLRQLPKKAEILGPILGQPPRSFAEATVLVELELDEIE